MKLSKKNKKRAKGEASVQTVPTIVKGSHPFMAVENYVPLTFAEMELYSSLREAVPIIDAAICKIVRLLGSFHIECNNLYAQKIVDDFTENIPIGGCNRGLLSFVFTYLDQLLTYGQAVGEMVMDKMGNMVALYNASNRDIVLKAGKSPIDIRVCVKETAGEKEVPYPQFILSTLLNPVPGEIRGTSILKGLPFVTDILLKIMQSVGNNWERVGNVRFAVTYKPDKDSLGNMYTKEKVSEIASEWSKAIHDTNGVSDFVSVGDVSIKVIGADNQVMDCDVPIRHMTEQIVAKLSIPPFLLGLSWSTTERMSSQQADILTSELEYYRTVLNPVIRKIVRTFFVYKGMDEDFEIVWDYINLQDEVELSSARLNNAKAKQIEETLNDTEVIS